MTQFPRRQRNVSVIAVCENHLHGLPDKAAMDRWIGQADPNPRILTIIGPRDALTFRDFCD